MDIERLYVIGVIKAEIHIAAAGKSYHTKKKRKNLCKTRTLTI